MTLQESIREYLLEHAVRAGKLTPERVPAYREMYDRDPRGTASLINNLAPGITSETAGALASFGDQSPYDRSIFPELRQRPRAALAPALVAPEPPSSPSPVAEAPPPATAAVAGWSKQLFPEVRERKAQGGSRVTWAEPKTNRRKR